MQCATLKNCYMQNGMQYQSFCRRCPRESMFSMLQLSVWEVEYSDLLILTVAYNVLCKKKKYGKENPVGSILKKWEQQGAYQPLVRELQGNGESFQQYFQLTRAVCPGVVPCGKWSSEAQSVPVPHESPHGAIYFAHRKRLWTENELEGITFILMFYFQFFWTTYCVNRFLA